MNTSPPGSHRLSVVPAGRVSALRAFLAVVRQLLVALVQAALSRLASG
ncbi:MAG: hypothetical protein RL434_1652, partial [Pseudomonadota bacterium]